LRGKHYACEGVKAVSFTVIQSPTAIGTSDVNSSIATLANGNYVIVYESGDSNPFFDDVRARYSRGKTAMHSRSPLAARFSHAKPRRERYSRIVAGFLQNRKIIRFRMKNHPIANEKSSVSQSRARRDMRIIAITRTGPVLASTGGGSDAH
jgi:hypothetical protein